MMRGKFFLRALGGIAFSALVVGCASQNGYDTYPSSSAGVTQSVKGGTVIEVRRVNIEGEAGYVGASSGAIVGGAIGSTVGSGDGSVLASAGGSVVGGLIGAEVQKKMTTKAAQEVTIEMDDGGRVVVVQEMSDPEFIVGDRVSVMETPYGNARIKHELFDEFGLASGT